MSEPEISVPAAAPAAVPEVVARLTDGEWHRLHPATPLLKGGFALIVVLGYVVSNLRERLLGMFLPRFDDGGDPVDYVVSHGIILQVLGGVALLLVVLISGFYVSWRMHTFRITDEVVEVRSGILFRTNRKARIDRIQGINIVRPFISRLFGAAKLEISQAGNDANVHLSYLSSAAADDLRREILRRASGTRAAERVAAVATGSFIDRRVNELLAPELDPDAAPPESVVKIHLGRLFGSMFLGTGTVIAVLVVVGATIWISLSGDFFVLFFALPSIIGFGGYYARKFSQSLRYTIAGTPDGVRVGFGLFSTSNETLPPGRIHSIEVSQPLLWRPAGWWQIRVNRASHTSSRGSANQANTTILPVGNLADVTAVLKLMLPDFIGDETSRFIESGMTSRGADGFTNSPRRAAWFRPFSWRRNGFATVPGSLVLRKGATWRRLIIVPQPRLQSVGLHQGPLLRRLRLASVHLHTVHGPITAELGAVDQGAALAFFTEVSELAVRADQADTSHRWRSGELPA
ncbi:PH domain-containing protein [Glaciihabitans sp. INWT7]|uniref:PH domain-containing protein n=1 Tax=Glaciihabitans sp. INWT7 TaxID=2596912 RepID=UPI001624ABD6|nr:PH domain-containing protein [Glaciihabitans sp. INWT7]QNE48030.1 PH domain-containing protein [Glaciihabitans sp. INWT7]